MRFKLIGRRAAFATVLPVLSVSYLLACQTLRPYSRPLHASLRTDSAEFGVRLADSVYMAKIGFVYVNTTGGVVSKAGCGRPPDPLVEKRVAGEWIPAYNPVYLACLTKPDFRLESGATFRDVIEFRAYERGGNTWPKLLVDSIDGIYRLRWDFVEGFDATDTTARRVEAVSNEFRMILRAAPRASNPGSTETDTGFGRSIASGHDTFVTPAGTRIAISSTENPRSFTSRMVVEDPRSHIAVDRCHESKSHRYAVSRRKRLGSGSVIERSPALF